MGVFWEEIPASLVSWILEQNLLCVATAPLTGNGHVNVSPKGGAGGQYFGIVDSKTFWYLDLTGSGVETISHLHEPGNGRITIMFSAFVGPPKIVRLWGKGEVLECKSKAFNAFVQDQNIELTPGTRSIILVRIHQVGSSCGFSVPYYDFKNFRPILDDLWRKRDEKFKAGNEKESMERYWAYKNAWSMDGMPGMKLGVQTARQEKIDPIKKMVGPFAPANGTRYTKGVSIIHILVIALLCFLLGMLTVSFQPEINQALRRTASKIDVNVARGLLRLTSR